MPSVKMCLVWACFQYTLTLYKYTRTKKSDIKVINNDDKVSKKRG